MGGVIKRGMRGKKGQEGKFWPCECVQVCHETMFGLFTHTLLQPILV